MRGLWRIFGSGIALETRLAANELALRSTWASTYRSPQGQQTERCQCDAESNAAEGAAGRHRVLTTDVPSHLKLGKRAEMQVWRKQA